MKGCIADAACGQPDLVCDLTTNLCTAGWLADVSDMIAAGERALVIARAVAASLATAGDTRTGGTLVRLASVLGDLLALRGEEEAPGVGVCVCLSVSGGRVWRGVGGGGVEVPPWEPLSVSLAS